MIFSNRVYKIPSGKNLSFYAENTQKVSMTIFKNLTEKKEIDFSSGVKCLSLPVTFDYNKVIKLSNSHNLICLDKYISIVDNNV